MPIVNPILPGFNPDPSIVRVGDDYYVATSTFEWFPGVQIHHSRDLVHWRLVGRPLDRASQLDMRGNPDSGGVWAPCLTHADGLFWLVFTDVKRREGTFKDTPNYLVTAPAIEGPWSDPVYLNCSGFDPSLFHDEDGRKWLVNLIWDHRGRTTRFGGIILQEFDPAAGRLTGPIRRIFAGTPLGLTEGPHLYRRDGWYYLVVAEGGTGYNHAVTMARARDIGGPYELHPDVHVITSRFAAEPPLKRAGHGDMVETQTGETYMVHLASRPYDGLKRSPLGRETAIQRLVWGPDGWPRLAGERFVPELEVQAPDLPPHPFPPEPIRYDFDEATLPLAFQWLRTPVPERIFSLSERPGHLRLYGREAIGSWFEQALVARRQVHFAYRAETEIDFAPTTHLEFAGLVAYYNRCAYHYLAVNWDATAGRCLTILSCEGNWPLGLISQPLVEPVPIPAEGPVGLRVEVDGPALRFFFRVGSGDWTRIGPVLDASLLSDECGAGDHANFTGAFVGMAASDLGGTAKPADFAFFAYAPL